MMYAFQYKVFLLKSQEKRYTLKEEWKNIKGYEGLYQVSNFGNVRNQSGRILKTNESEHGYLKLELNNNRRKKTIHIHRLVAAAFIENPFHYAEVNHIDEDKHNNCADNLEWVSHLYNVRYGNRPRMVGRYAKVHGGNTVYQYDRNNVLVNEFRSIREAERITGYCRQIIGKYIDTGIPYKGFLWKR